MEKVREFFYPLRRHSDRCKPMKSHGPSCKADVGKVSNRGRGEAMGRRERGSLSSGTSRSSAAPGPCSGPCTRLTYRTPPRGSSPPPRPCLSTAADGKHRTSLGGCFTRGGVAFRIVNEDEFAQLCLRVAGVGRASEQGGRHQCRGERSGCYRLAGPHAGAVSWLLIVADDETVGLVGKHGRRIDGV
jgi:hypothetical protein